MNNNKSDHKGKSKQVQSTNTFSPEEGERVQTLPAD